MTLLTYADLIADTLQLIPKLPRIDLIAGVPRKGMIPATILAETLRVPLYMSADRIAARGSYARTRCAAPPTILLIDEAICTGGSMLTAWGQLKRETANLGAKIVVAAVYNASEGETPFLYIDNQITAEIVTARRYTPNVDLCVWDMFQHPLTQKWIFDFDGVLCVDRDPSIVDHSIAYDVWLREAKPLYITQFPVHSICTWRTEAYREPSMAWLRNHGMPLADGLRMHMPKFRGSSPSAFKADYYKSCDDATMFVESDPDQARDIWVRSEKSVLCVNPWRLFA